MKLIGIGLISGIILILVMKCIQIVTGNDAYILLFNFDYLPVVKELKPIWFFGYLFHFMTCIISIVILYYALRFVGFEKHISPYVLVYTIGGAILFFLTLLSDQLPAGDDWMAWLYWTFGHAVFSYVVGLLIKKWM